MLFSVFLKNENRNVSQLYYSMPSTLICLTLRAESLYIAWWTNMLDKYVCVKRNVITHIDGAGVYQLDKKASSIPKKELNNSIGQYFYK